ncbi:hypothetical protein CDL12_08071 [Handroanthus impetiginosus]|uniref:PB1-like domain-containing protein n=1 Tax=Handroanthus impetiginosus TaxID=429701 RepID=A0A2G9HP80_9LAMI|nr:hypothetical protein CDL12_08071 [Handroanthus impetiginosus]
MEWVLLTDTTPKVPPGRITPKYGENSEYFTIRIRHSGTFVFFGTPSYLGGEISHIDFCNSNEMSLIEIHSMAKEIGLEGNLAYYFSSTGVNDTNALIMIKDDFDVVNLCNFIDENRMVGVFINHQKFAPPSSASESLESIEKPSKGFSHSVHEGLEVRDEVDNTMVREPSKGFSNSIDERLDNRDEADNIVGREPRKGFSNSRDEGLEIRD